MREPSKPRMTSNYLSMTLVFNSSTIHWIFRINITTFFNLPDMFRKVHPSSSV